MSGPSGIEDRFVPFFTLGDIVRTGGQFHQYYRRHKKILRHIVKRKETSGNNDRRVVGEVRHRTFISTENLKAPEFAALVRLVSYSKNFQGEFLAFS